MENRYEYYWKVFENGIHSLKRDNKNVSFQILYNSVYQMCQTIDGCDRFGKDLDRFINGEIDLVDRADIDRLNDILIYYTNKTGRIITNNTKLFVEI